MGIGQDKHLPWVAFLGIWVGTCICCALAIAFFYGLGREGTTIYPFKDRAEQTWAVLQTSAAATLSSSWGIWFGARRKRSPAMNMLRTAFATQVSLTFYSIIGMQLATKNLRSAFDLIFRSTFFAEYNWLTFILEVAPVTSCGATLLLLVFLGRNTSEIRSEDR